MKFKSKRSFWVGIIFWSVPIFMTFLTMKVLIFDYAKWMALLCVLPAFLLVLTWFNTFYLIEDGLLKYKSGFINGSIEIKEITQITTGKTMYIGLKPALSSNGCIIKYGKWDDIYLSPENQELFNAELLKINPAIKILD